MEALPSDLPEIPMLQHEPGPDGILGNDDDVLYWTKEDTKKVVIFLFLFSNYVNNQLTLCGLIDENTDSTE